METATQAAQADPIWAILRHRGQSIRWLATATGLSYGYLRLIACGRERPTPRVRQLASVALGMPERYLFVTACSGAEQPVRVASYRYGGAR